MIHLLRIILFLGPLRLTLAQPSTEIILLDLNVSGDNITAANASNITRHPAAYDNQPFFHPEKDLLYYASADDAGRTDIKVYDYKNQQTSILTRTAEREFSPTVTPDKQYISCIIQRENGAQDLGMYPIDGGPVTIIVDRLTVGYHAWLNAKTLLMFVLAEPPAMHQYNVVDKTDSVRAYNIGRSFQVVPHTHAVSYVQKSKDGPWTINQIDADGSVTVLAETLAGREDIAWLPDGRLLMTDGRSVFVAMRHGTWKEIKISSSIYLKNISRLAVNGNGTKLALVIEE